MKTTLLNKDLVDVLRQPINAVWQIIGGDICNIEGDDVPNRHAIDACLDADRLTEFGFPEADKAFKIVVAECNKFDDVLDYLDLHIRIN
jgi:hypothetical protein